MKRALPLLLTVILVLAALPALAFEDHDLAPLDGWLNQRMALRTGPNTGYTEMFTLPESTPIALYEREMGNGVDWVQVEFEYNGEMYRGYTGMKRVETDADVPWIDVDGVETRTNASVTPRFGPGEEYARHEDAIKIDAPVTAFYEENGYTMIDYASGSDERVRAWVRSSALDGCEAPETGDDVDSDEIYVPFFPYSSIQADANQKLSLRSGPSTAYTSLGTMPKDTFIRLYYKAEGNDVLWGYLEYEYKGEMYRGYTGMKRIDVNADVPFDEESSVKAFTAVKTRLWYGPDEDAYAALPGTIPAGSAVRVYYAERSEEFLLVDYDDGGQIRRGWMPTENLDGDCFFFQQ